MRYRHLLLVTALLCANVAAQQAAPKAVQGSDRWGPVPSPASTATGAYRDTLSTAAADAQRFNFSDQPGKDKAPPDQTPIRVIINNGHGPHINCVPMGVSGACH